MAIHFDTQGPAPNGFHVPLNTEWQAIRDVWAALGGWSSDWTNFWIALKLPFAGNRSYSSSGVENQGTIGSYWSSNPYDSNNSYYLYFRSSGINSRYDSYRSYGRSVRCFKDTPTIPTNSWTKLYWTSIEAGWIFWNTTDWLISLSSDWTTWITIADKNVWATTVWNSWDTLSEANCGYYYQRWNNYGFSRYSVDPIATSSTQVDASTYWPWNYYSSSIFITSWLWDSSYNDNLRWWVSQWMRYDPMRLHWTIQTFHRAPHYDWYLNGATIAYYPLTEDLLDHKTNQKDPINLSVSWSGYSFGTNWFWQAWVQLTWSTYFYPWSWNVWGKHPWTDDMTIAFRVSNYSPAAYWGSWSWYHCWILSFGRQFKTWIMWDWVLGKDVGILDSGYEWFSLDSNYVWSTTENPKTLNWVTAETYLNSYLSVVDTFHNWHHTRYISNIWASTPFAENDYASTKTVDVNYIWRDNYSSSNYRYFRWYMRDFVVSWDVWTPAMINAYFNEDLGGWTRKPTTNTLLYFPLTDDLIDHSWKSVTSTTTGSPTITTLNWVKCCQLNGSSTIDTDVTLNTLSNVYASCWFYTANAENKWIFWNQPCWVFNWFWFSLTNSSNFVVEVYYSGSSSTSASASWSFQGSWHLYSVSNWKLYIDWIYKSTLSTTTLNWNQPMCIWWHNQNSSCTRQKVNWYIGDCILENKERTASEIADYYNNTKSNYGL